MKENPFLITGYSGPDYFCNREKETGRLKEAFQNGRNMTLFSPRRLGKTGLIHHLFHGLSEEPVNTIYVDIYGTEDLNGFVNKLVNAVLSSIPGKKDHLLKKALDLFGRLRPQISYDSLSGAPQVSFSLQSEAEKQSTIGEVFEILETQEVRNIIAIDEFQQISEYPETGTERLLRSHVQQLNNSSFLFAGSQRHMLLPMFSDPGRAFFQSTGFLALQKLDPGDYKSFIMHLFGSNRQEIEPESVDFIIEWTEGYTFYTQYLCNRIYSRRKNRITGELILECIAEILAERETIFFNYRNLLSHHQYRLLRAVALEGEVREPTGQVFISQYELGNASTVRKSLLALIDKEMIYGTPGEGKTGYRVYDVFLSRWFRWKENRD